MPTNLELAKQGDPNAIAALLNRSLQPKGITATAEQENGFLHVMLHSPQVPPHKQIVDFIQQGMNKLETPVIHTVRIDSYQAGSNSPAWSDEFGLASAMLDQSDFPPVIDDPSLDDYSDSVDMMANQPHYDEPQYDELPQEEYEDGVEDDEHEEQPPPAKAKRQPSKLLLALLGILVLALAGVGAAFALKLGPFAETAEAPPAPAPAPAKPAAPATAKAPTPNATPAPVPKPATPAPATKPATPAANAPKPATPAPAPKPATPAANAPKPATPAPATKPATPAPAPTSTTTSDPWRDAVKKAETAGKLAYDKPPQTPEEWDALAKQWQAAIDGMKKVPANHPKYKEAQQKIKDYQINLDYAKQNAGT